MKILYSTLLYRKQGASLFVRVSKRNKVKTNPKKERKRDL